MVLSKAYYAQYHIGTAYLNQGNHNGAVESFEALLDRYPKSIFAPYVNMGRSFKALGQADSAMSFAKRSLAVLLLSWLPVGAASGIQPASGQTNSAWSVAYSDGRSILRCLKPRGWMWTTRFPRHWVETLGVEWPGRLELQYSRHENEGDFVVSLLRGRPETEERVEVKRVRVSVREPAVIEELQPFGVDPIVVSIIPCLEEDCVDKLGRRADNRKNCSS